METPVHSVPAKTSGSVIRLTTIVPDTTVESEAAQHVQEPEDEQVEDRSRKEALWRDLGETQINLPMHSTTGNGLFLGSGAALAVAGPFGGVLAYLLVGTVISSVVSCLGEMTALMPVNAPVVEFPRRFLDRGVGFAVGWMYWFTFVVVAAQNLVIAARTAKLHYDDDKTFLAWGRGENVDAHIWFALFMFTVLIINLFPVKYLGMFDYAMGTMKLLVQTHTMMGQLGPSVWSRSGSVQREIGGSAGKLLGMWSACINVMYDYAGLEIFAAPAAESKSLADSESMKIAARKIYIRVMVLYTLAFLTGSFLVPSDHPFINGHAQSTSSRSIFLIAVVEAGIPTLAHFYNVIFLITTLICAINSVYVASRALHTLALREQTGPNFITRRLQRCNSGVPMRTVVVTVIMMFLGFMSHNDSEKGPFMLTHEYHRLKEARASGNPSECYATFYDRNNPRYPYKSHAQWFKALWGMTACTILCIFSGATTFLRTPFDTHGFIVSYISVWLAIIPYQ
ncbi:hypothetical protein CIHG_00283 [Coccidioides immitis H538.4]|uniref:Amino acid permease/ SLC12A domain-containing protein n=3 Tax=Coccidioides immitis TaxID=5501 RepID=A0A0J8QIE8_COCIT|nr:hypothetical protein CIRG_07103 [Coccidioides immitis RMSCC 2394]KMU72124.1 hypothetical protein CISG_00433 [Coccidioides immitis RMSCC 3703]KMU82501.1 hypothetical protein CIHG_00283 [Coccidioides immitis H538.4]